MRVHLDQRTLYSMNINLQPARLIQRRVEQRQEALMCDVRPGVRDITTRLCEDALMVVAIKQRVFCLTLAPVARVAGFTNLVCLEARLFKHDKKSAGAGCRRQPTRDVRLHWDHRWIKAGHASRTTARQWSCRPWGDCETLIGVFMSPTHTLCRRWSENIAGPRSTRYFFIV